MFNQVAEKTLREILRVMHSVSATAHETVKRPPVSLAKLRERGLCILRFVLAFTRGDNHAPVGRRKQIFLAMSVPCEGLHVSVCIKIAGKKQTVRIFYDSVQQAHRNPVVQGKKQ